MLLWSAKSKGSEDGSRLYFDGQKWYLRGVRIARGLVVATMRWPRRRTLKRLRLPPAGNRPIAIVGARLIDGTGAPPVDDAVVVVEGDRIRAAGPRRAVQVPRGATSSMPRARF